MRAPAGRVLADALLRSDLGCAFKGRRIKDAEVGQMVLCGRMEKSAANSAFARM